MKSINFEDFWLKLQENEPWFDQIKMRFCRKDLKPVANECFIFLLALEQRWAAQDYQDFRKCYQSFLTKAPDKPVAPQLQQTEVKEEKKSDPPLTGEARMAWIKKWEAEVKGSPMMQTCAVKLTYKQIADEGDWLPKKPAPYPSSSHAEVKKRLFHLIYLRNNFDREGGKLPTWKEESEWSEENSFELEEIWQEQLKQMINL